MSCHPRTSEPKQYVSTINKAQQAYFSENQKFANSIDELGLGIKTQTENFNYSTRVTEKAAFTYAMQRHYAEDFYEPVSFGLFSWRKWWEKPIKSRVRSYIGSVSLVPVDDTNSPSNNNTMTTESILCEETNPTSQTKLADPTLQNGHLTCGNGTQITTK